MVKMKKEEDLGTLVEELDKDITQRYAIEDVTSKKKRIQYGVILFAVAFLVVGSFLFYFKYHLNTVQEQHATPLKMALSDMTVAEGEKTKEWTYDQFMKVPYKNITIDEFIQTYGKADNLSQTRTSSLTSLILDYTFYDQNRFEFVSFHFDETEEGNYVLVMKTASNLLKQKCANQGKSSQKSWTKEAYDKLLLTNEETNVKGEQLEIILKSYGEPEGDSVVVFEDGFMLVTLNYLSYQDGEMLNLMFESSDDDSLRLLNKDSFASPTVNND
ncbi:hypothetical protein ACVR05_03770 [Streptococcus caprae]|uniref:Conjugal transfer protein n=1 Tax=Streptococcus caprae TaxID=1640501 RepID=A0ABV8CSP6_9STRE